MSEDPSKRIESLEQQVKYFGVGFMVVLIAAIALGVFTIYQHLQLKQFRADLQSARALLQADTPAAKARDLEAQAEYERAKRALAERARARPTEPAEVQKPQP